MDTLSKGTWYHLMKEKDGSIMMEMLSQNEKKYEKYYFDLHARIKKGTRVVYIPAYDGFIHIYYEGGYSRFKYKPGDTMTVKLGSFVFSVEILGLRGRSAGGSSEGSSRDLGTRKPSF